MVEIVETEDVLGGKARIQGRRISAFQIGEMYTGGEYTAEDIADQFDLDLAEVHAALSYYYDHPDEMDTVRERKAELEEDLRERSRAPEELEQ